jgi:glycerol-3-phosphate O-acyltransferase/dihydroxyacetone phosphate acyltransferase
LKGSTVKVAGRDVLATWKVLVGLVLVPSLYTFYSICILGFLIKFSLFSLKGKLIVAVLSWFFVAIVSYGSLLSGDIGLDIAK